MFQLPKYLLSEKTKHRSEQVILSIAILSYLVHLAIIYALRFNWIQLNVSPELFNQPSAAIYTPFSFIIAYEVYLLVYYLPQSITTYISKQYEIITLILIRRSFKDLSNLELTSDWFQVKNDLVFTYDIIASLLLFVMLYFFYRSRQVAQMKYASEDDLPDKITRFIQIKRWIAALLIPVLIGLALYTFTSWLVGTIYPHLDIAVAYKDINNVFFDEFFSLMIIVDVILLLISFFHTDEFHKVIRNSGFVISTILIRLSFSVDGLINTALIVFAVLFGLLILIIHNKYEEHSIKPEA